jgi:copper(I)-binding protein
MGRSRSGGSISPVHRIRVAQWLAWIVLIAGGGTAACGQNGFNPAEWNAPGADTRIGEIKIRFGYAAEPPPGTTFAPGADVPVYLHLFNEASKDDALLGASTPAAARAEQANDDGTVRTEPWAIPAGSELLLTPGGPHLILRDLTGPLRGGDFIRLELRFAKAGQGTVSLPVQPQTHDRSPGPSVEVSPPPTSVPAPP